MKNKKWLTFALCGVIAASMLFSACSSKKGETGHTHTYADEYTAVDENYHWRAPTCGDTEEGTDKAAHVWSSNSNSQVSENGVGVKVYTCTVCGFTYRQSVGDVTESPDETNSGETDSNKTNSGETDPDEDGIITYIQAGNENIAVEWADSAPSSAEVSYRKSGTESWTKADSMLIRAADSSTARVDIVGLVGGSEYDIQIVTSAGKSVTRTGVSVSAYDRSGYAHFNYTEGVGAYTDSGELKQGALVIYLTEGNKNNIKDYVYRNGEKVDITEYVTDSSGTAHWGIGEILNNRRYSGTDRMNVGIAKLCSVYGAVDIRVLGEVSADVNADGTYTITGLTDYDSTGNGGSEGDNGRMARMVNAKNLTVEGIGTDAGLTGWGLHFISSDNLHSYEGVGKSFEVRNLTFKEYPEDAIGMEGTQGTKVDETGSITSGASSAEAELISPVERCWIHHNSFLPGYCANPAESDKAEGDGSCDFKRGQYYTLSYNTFEGCHKTNLIGSSDTSLQYNMSIHHNYWKNCGSRMPLMRRGNVHFYNNYIFGDISDGDADLSYVSSVRANSYMFAENNYYDGCKNPVQLASGGVAKAYGNSYYACFEDNEAVQVTTRTQSVSNSCKYIYGNIDYSSFDTDSTLFYYNSETQTSDCYITDAVTARKEVLIYAGVLKRSYDNISTNMNAVTPTSAISIGEGLTVSLSSVSKGSSSVSGVEFSNITSVSSGTVKGEGQIATFTVTARTQVTFTVSGTAEVNLGALVGSDGTVYLSGVGGDVAATAIVPAGTYFIASGSKDKEVTLTSLSFKNGASDAELLSGVEAAIAAIPDTVTLDSSCAALIAAARTAYNALPSSLQVQITTYEKLTRAEADYSDLLVQNAVTLINNIGTVNSSSYDAITAARTAYDGLTSAERALVTNYSTLTQAEADYANIAVDAVIDEITNLASVSSVSGRSELEAAFEAYNAVKTKYDALTETQQVSVTNASKLTDGITELEAGLAPYLWSDRVTALPETSALTSANMTEVAALRTLYQSFTEGQKAVIEQAALTKYTAAVSWYEEEAAKVAVILFYSGKTDSEYSAEGVTITSGSYKSGSSNAYTYNGEEYSPLKMESKTQITITVAAAKTLCIHTDGASKTIKVNGTACTTDSDGVAEVAVEAGTVTITKGDSLNLCYIELK